MTTKPLEAIVRDALIAARRLGHMHQTPTQAQLDKLIADTLEAVRQSQPAGRAEVSQFLADVMTAAGLVSHGKQCKALGARLGEGCMKMLGVIAYPSAEPVQAQQGGGAGEPVEVMRELLELTVKAARRSAYDLAHAADMVKDDHYREMFAARAKDWLTIFNPSNGPKDYRSDMHRQIAFKEMRIGRLEALCKENGIDCKEM